MPKSQTINEKYINGIKVDKENKTCFYNDEKHVYYDKEDMSKYISVTTLISKYCEEFDGEFWASYKALESLLDMGTWLALKKTLLAAKKFKPTILKKLDINIDEFNAKKQEILDQYQTAKNEACEHGTAEHLRKELSFYNEKSFDFSKYGYKDVKGDFKCIRDYFELDLDKGVYPEFLLTVKDDGLKIGGQIDCLIKDGDDIIILDWKGLDVKTPILTTKGWKTMGTLTLDDVVFDKDGNQTKILHISQEHRNPCYELRFDNNDAIIADEDHRWLVNCSSNKKEQIMTTKEIHTFLKNNPKQRIRIYNPKKLNTCKKNLPIDPYVLGAWLGGGSQSCGVITNANESFWNEIKRRGYSIGKNLSLENKTEMRTVFGLYSELRMLNLLKNKHIPIEYLLASQEQRIDLLRGLMDTDGFLHKRRKGFVMECGREWQASDLAKLVSTLGLKPTVFKTNNKLNPFLIRNKSEFEKICVIKDNNTFRNIESIIPVKTVTTKCIEVDSPTHTYLCGEHLIVTHNTNKEITKTSYYNRATRKYKMMKYPLDNLQDCTLVHYQLQLSLYAYLLQKIKPELNVKGLKIIHIDRDRKETEYEIPYLKEDIERMLAHYKKQLKIQEQLDRNKPIVI